MFILSQQEVLPASPDLFADLNSTAAVFYGDRLFALTQLYKTQTDAISSCRSLLDENVLNIIIKEGEDSSSLWTEVQNWRSLLTTPANQTANSVGSTAQLQKTEPVRHQRTPVQGKGQQRQLQQASETVAKWLFRKI